MKVFSIVTAAALLATPILAARKDKAIEIDNLQNASPNIQYVTVREPAVTVYPEAQEVVTLTLAAMEVITQTYTPTVAETIQETVSTTYTPSTSVIPSSTSMSSSTTYSRSSTAKSCTTLNIPIETTIDGQSTSFMSEISTCVNPGTRFENEDDEDDENSALPLIMGAIAIIPAMIVALL